MRDDDVLLKSSTWSKPFLRFKELHEYMTQTPKIIHVPALLYKESQHFGSELVDYIKQETKLHRIQPEIHGYEHINYGTRVRGTPGGPKDSPPETWTPEEVEAAKNWVREEIKFTRDWITETFGRAPKFWYTPWGANQSHLYEVAKELGLILVDCNANFAPIENVCEKLRNKTTTIERLDGMEVFFHWWSRGNRVHRLTRAIQYGSWDEAAKRFTKLF